jgi:putative glutamine amidotransferase
MAVVGIVCDVRRKDGMASHRMGDEYVTAVRDGAGALPLLIPVTESPLALGDILDAVDGLLFPGSPSNVEPARYGGEGPGSHLDTARDATSLALIRAGLKAGKPMLGICRGFQELNVALGGTLHQRLQDVPGKMDHREDPDAPLAVQYGPAHNVRFTPGGLLAKLTGETEAMVNSLHGQGIDRLAPGLAVDAAAQDGVIEAVTAPAAHAFAFGTQWHMEWDWSKSPVNQAIWVAFGRALMVRPVH